MLFISVNIYFKYLSNEKMRKIKKFSSFFIIDIYFNKIFKSNAYT